MAIWQKDKPSETTDDRVDIINSPDPDYSAIARDPAREWNERMWAPDERFENRYQVRRTDGEILKEIQDRIAAEIDRDLQHVIVRVSGGEVMLSGDVSSEDDLKLCHRLTDAVLGVQHIYNNIDVVPEPS